MKKLIIIPAFNEEHNIPRMVEKIKLQAPGFDYVIINDCSQDQTEELCRSNGYHAIHLPINLGIGGAVQTGYQYAGKQGYEIAVQIDGDGQHDIQYLEEMVECLQKENTDMVIGSRFIRKEGYQSSGIRRAGICYFNFLIHLLTGMRITDSTSGMRMVNRDIIMLFAEEYPKDYPEPESIVTLHKKGKHVGEIPVIMHERENGISSISTVKSIYYMIKVSLAILIAWWGK